MVFVLNKYVWPREDFNVCKSTLPAVLNFSSPELDLDCFKAHVQ